MNKFLLLVIIGAVLFYTFKWWENRKRKRLVHNVQESIGIMDPQAQEAKETFQEIYLPDTQDILNYNRIVELNENEGRIENPQEFNRIVEQYTNVLDDELDWFEIHQIENFVDRHQDMLNHREHNQFLDNIIEAPKKQVQKTLEEIKNTTDTKSEAVKEYTEASKTHTSDSQNVHDSAVNVQLRDGYKQLKDQIIVSLNKSQIQQEIREKIDTLPPQEKNRAYKAFNTIVNNKASLSSLDNDTEDRLLELVWLRSKQPENETNKDLIQDSIMNSLVDITSASSTDAVVCAGGRCTRVYDSLVLLDQDPSFSKGLATTEQIKNDMLEKSNEILQDKIKEYSNYKPSDLDEKERPLVDAAKSYTDPSVQVSELVEKDFKELVIKDISDHLETEYKDKLSKRDYSNIKNQCIEGITSI